MIPAQGMPARDERRERIIAVLLRYGTWLASGLVALGMTLGALSFEPPLPFGLQGSGLAKAGIALFILLPVARVALMAALFLQERDYLYATIAALVLAIIATGVFIELA